MGPTSKIVTSPAWFLPPAARASCSKRCSCSFPEANDLGSTFTATSRRRRWSRARHTSPIPPEPRWDTISYGPRETPFAISMKFAEVWTLLCPIPWIAAVNPLLHLRRATIAHGSSLVRRRIRGRRWNGQRRVDVHLACTIGEESRREPVVDHDLRDRCCLRPGQRGAADVSRGMSPRRLA